MRSVMVGGCDQQRESEETAGHTVSDTLRGVSVVTLNSTKMTGLTMAANDWDKMR